VLRDVIHSFHCLGDCCQRDIRRPTGCSGKTSEMGKGELCPVGVAVIRCPVPGESFCYRVIDLMGLAIPGPEADQTYNTVI
jgi:hypothetical protein